MNCKNSVLGCLLGADGRAQETKTRLEARAIRAQLPHGGRDYGSSRHQLLDSRSSGERKFASATDAPLNPLVERRSGNESATSLRARLLYSGGNDELATDQILEQTDREAAVG